MSAADLIVVRGLVVVATAGWRLCGSAGSDQTIAIALNAAEKRGQRNQYQHAATAKTHDLASP
jgi:hypothetical protein